MVDDGLTQPTISGTGSGAAAHRTCDSAHGLTHNAAAVHHQLGSPSPVQLVDIIQHNVQGA
eukprot:9884600-Alexandrium_andersonii.AAC.1